MGAGIRREVHLEGGALAHAAAALQPHLSDVKRLHASDLAAGGGAIVLPDALSRKYPTMATDWGWQWVFPARRRYLDLALG